MIDIKKAKVKFLSLAFQGALVDYPNKEKSNEALNAIHSKQKGFAPVETEEFLIVAPSYWNWSRLGYITKNHGQIVPDTDFCYIDVGTLDNVHQRLAEKENLVNAKDAPSRARKIVQFGDVLYSTVRPYLHNICVIDKNFSRTPIASTAFCVMQANESVLLNEYLFYWLLTPEFDKYSNGDPSKGALYPAIGEKDLLRGVIPLPSVDEQRLIVEKIEQAFSVLDTIDELQAQYADNLTVLKSKLIDLAIRGKLTEQLPEDGTAEELYQQIQEEKQALIKSGKIKKEKTLPEINAEEIPFEIPGSWKWVRLSSAFDVRDGTHDTPKYYDHGVPLVTSKNLSSGILGFEDVKLISCEDAVKINERSKVNRGDILFAMIGTIGNPVIVDTDVEFCIKNIALFKPLQGTKLNMEYLRFYLLMEQNELKRISVGGLQPFVSLKQFRNHPFPLPPLAEQKRIVDRLDKLLAVCDEMK